jgi:membrane-associated phospholipid phosphatase
VSAPDHVRPLSPGQRRRLGVLALSLAAAFFAVAALAEARLLFGAELWVQQRVQATRTPRLEAPMRGASLLGSGGVLVATTAAACVVLWRRRRRLAHAVAAVGVTGYLAADLAKLIAIRQRPNTVMWAFPSSHTFGIVVFLGMLVYLLWALEVAPRRRRLATLVGGLAVLAVAGSRLYLNAHWLGDVIGGVAGGAAFVLAAVLVIDWRLGAASAALDPPARRLGAVAG